MATQALDLAGGDAFPWAVGLRAERLKFVWLALGLAATLLSVGGRWDIGLAAWLAPIFLLRFLRLSRPASGLLVVWMVCVAAAFFWGYQLAVRVQLSTAAGHIAFGTMFTLPYVLDRIAGARLSPAWRLFLFPAALAAAEFLMASLSPLGTAYGLRAITQTGNLPLLQVVSVTGPYTIAFLIGLGATIANAVWEGPARDRLRRFALPYAALMLLVLLGGAASIAFFPARGPYVRIAGITPSNNSIEQAKAQFGSDFPKTPAQLAQADPAKLNAAFAIINNDLLVKTHEAARAGAQIVLWSETAARLSPATKPAFLAQAAQVARQDNIYLDATNGVPFARNESHLFSPAGEMLWAYQKNHPVPGMEPVPPAHTPVPIVRTPYGRLSNIICFDADFPSLARRQTDIMMVPGADWLEMGRVHTLKMASLRAIENGYSLVRQDFDGQSAAFDRHGNVLATEDTTTPGEHLMLVDVPTKGAPTIYSRIGDLFVWLCIAATGLAVGLAVFRPHREALQ